MNENDELPTAFQPGAPAARPALEDEASDADVQVRSNLDRIAEWLKRYDCWGLAVGVGIQLLVLAATMVLGAAKMLGGDVWR
jgi:hypothetical protein